MARTIKVFRRKTRSIIDKMQEMEFLQNPELRKAYLFGIKIGRSHNLSALELKDRIINWQSWRLRQQDAEDALITDVINLLRGRPGGFLMIARLRYQFFGKEKSISH